MKRHISIFFAVAACFTAVDAIACTTAIVGPKASATGKVLLWKQRDGSNPHNVLEHRPAAEGKFAFTGIFNVSDTARVNCWGGSNAKGFSIVNNMSYNVSADNVSKNNGKIITKALETCTTVDEFGSMVERMSPRLCSSNFAVIDATGHGAYFEVSDSVFQRYDVPDDGWLVRTNFSLAGEKDAPSGWDRYQAAEAAMKKCPGKFTAEYLVDKLGRNYENPQLGVDVMALEDFKAIRDDGFISRPTTVSSLCVEGSDLMWVSIGCTADCWCVPVLVSAGDAIPSFLTAAGEKHRSELCELSYRLNRFNHKFPRDSKDRYLDLDKARCTLSLVRRYESGAMRFGRACLTGSSVADINVIRQMNSELSAMFESFKSEVFEIMGEKVK